MTSPVSKMLAMQEHYVRYISVYASLIACLFQFAQNIFPDSFLARFQRIFANYPVMFTIYVCLSVRFLVLSNSTTSKYVFIKAVGAIRATGTDALSDVLTRLHVTRFSISRYIFIGMKNY